jgi:ketosteroid isomerase-like protein
MVRCYAFFVAAIALCSCNNKKPLPSGTVDEKVMLIQTDEAFSDMSVSKGMKAAFIEYIDSNGVLLKPGRLPIVGAGAIDYLIQQNDTGFTLNWQPQNAFVSKSADLGYTYGVYALHPKTIDTVFYGTYVSIWKKQNDGKWKFVLDSGNEGIDTLTDENL